MAQLIPTVVSTFVCTGVLNFQMNRIPEVCTPEAPNRFTCPGINTFFTASVLWGTIGPVKVFGAGGQYTALLVGFPFGLLLPIALWYLQKKVKTRWTRQLHPIALLYGPINWAPYNLSYMLPAAWIAWLSWIWCKSRFIGLWSKYNFVLSASFSSGIAIAAIVMFFALQYNGLELSWWGNDITSAGCEGRACTLLTLKEGGRFGPGPGQFT